MRPPGSLLYPLVVRRSYAVHVMGRSLELPGWRPDRPRHGMERREWCLDVRHLAGVALEGWASCHHLPIRLRASVL